MQWIKAHLTVVITSAVSLIAIVLLVLGVMNKEVAERMQSDSGVFNSLQGARKPVNEKIIEAVSAEQDKNQQQLEKILEQFKNIGTHKPINQHVFFSHLAELTVGKNILMIEAKDEAGNSVRKEIAVSRKIPRIPQFPEKSFSSYMRVAVLPFDQKGVVSSVSSLFQDILTFALLNQERFQVVERDSLDKILYDGTAINFFYHG